MSEKKILMIDDDPDFTSSVENIVTARGYKFDSAPNGEEGIKKAKIFLPDLIILDEPTNHIDEVTWEVLLQACQTSKSTILLVSHDYEFIEAFEPSVFWLSLIHI